MLNVSTKWQNAVKAQFRYPAYLKVTVEITPPELREDTSITSDYTFAQSSIQSLQDGIESVSKRYATGELNRALLNGTLDFLDSTDQTEEWWSNTLLYSDTSSTISFTFTFNKAYSVPGIFAIWDTLNNSYPLELEIKGYDINNTVTYDITVTDINSVSGFYTAEMDDITKVDLIIKGWSKPRWRARISELIFGYKEFFDNDRIISATQSSKSYPLGENLPLRTLDISLRNIDLHFDPLLKHGTSKYLARRQLATAQWGFEVAYGEVEWAPTMTYFIDTFDIPSDTRDVTIKTTSRLSFLTSTYYTDTYNYGQSRTLYDLAQSILQSSKSSLITSIKDPQPWHLPDILKNFTTVAPLPQQPVNQLLQLISNMSQCWLTTRATDGYVDFVPDSNEVVSEVTLEQALGDPAVEIKDRLRSIQVGLYTYTQGPSDDGPIASLKQIFKGTQTYNVKYNDDFVINVTASSNVSSVKINKITSYSTCAFLEIVAPEIGVEAEITLYGDEIVPTVTFRETYHDYSVTDGIDLTVDNPLITDVETVNRVSAFVQQYYSRRTTYSVNYLGYPELEPGDNIELDTIYGSNIVKITEHDISYNGAWNGGISVV